LFVTSCFKNGEIVILLKFLIYRRQDWITLSGRAKDFDENVHKHVCHGHFNANDLCEHYVYMKTTDPVFKGLPVLSLKALPSRYLPIIKGKKFNSMPH